jgi:hypothetical protein
MYTGSDCSPLHKRFEADPAQHSTLLYEACTRALLQEYLCKWCGDRIGCPDPIAKMRSFLPHATSEFGPADHGTAGQLELIYCAAVSLQMLLSC